MPNVILFRPKEVYSEAISFHRAPLGLIYIASYLIDHGFSVKIIDCETTDNWHDELKDALNEDVVLAGTGVMTGYQIQGALDFSKAVKEIRPIPVVWGGLHPSFLPEQTIQHENIDIVVIGEGEETLTNLAKQLQNSASIDNIPNIVFKKDGKIVHTPKDRGFLDMDTLMLPDYSLVDIEYYANHKREFMGKRKRCLDINTDRGCPYRCGFCYNLRFNDRQWRGMSSEKLIDAIEYMTESYNLDAVNLTSDNFFVNKKRVREFCEGLIKRNINISWHSDMRIDTFLKYDEDTLRLMMQSGCAELTFGIESGSDRILKLIQKDIQANDALKAHAKLKDLGLKVNYHFMIGFPDETRSDIIKTVKLMRFLLTTYKHADIYGPSTYIPYPNTPLFERSVEKGFKPPLTLEDWITYDWDEETKLSWFSSSHKRFLKEVYTISLMTNTTPSSFFRKLIKGYGNLRMLGISYGISLFDLDTAIARQFKK